MRYFSYKYAYFYQKGDIINYCDYIIRHGGYIIVYSGCIIAHRGCIITQRHHIIAHKGPFINNDLECENEWPRP